MRKVHSYGVGSVIVLVFSILLLSGYRLERGFNQPYYFVADQDVTLVTQALAINDGERQEYISHPGYGIIQALRAWFYMNKVAGFMKNTSLTPISESGTIAATLTEPVIRGRQLSLFLAVTAALLSTWFLLVVTDRPELALSAMALYCGSIGLFFQTTFIRTELMSHIFLVLAFALACKQARDPQSHKFHYAFLSGVALYIGLVSKIQIIFLAVFIPPFITLCQRPGRIPWWSGDDPTPRWKKAVFIHLPIGIGLVTLVALLVSAPKSFIVASHSALIMGLLFCWVFHVIWTQSSFRDPLPTYLSYLGGMGVGYLTTFISYTPGNHFAVLNFLDLLTQHCVSKNCESRNYTEVFNMLFQKIFVTAETKMSLAWMLERPAVSFFWITLAAILIQLFHRRTWQTYSAILFFAGAFALETIFRLRWAESSDESIVVYYTIYTDFFEVLAMLLALAPLIPKTARSARLTISAAMLIAAFSASRNMELGRRNRFTGVSIEQNIENQCIYLGYSPPIGNYIGKLGECEDVVRKDFAIFLKRGGRFDLGTTQ